MKPVIGEEAMDRAHHTFARDPLKAHDPRSVQVCASCGGTIDLVRYGAAQFCAECRDQSEPFAGKDLYCDLGGGD
jgi:hypothetical protein